MEHITTTHHTRQRNRRNPEGPPVARFYVTCSCGADSRRTGLGGTFTTAGMAAGWIAEHDPRLRNMVGILQAETVPA